MEVKILEVEVDGDRLRKVANRFAIFWYLCSEVERTADRVISLPGTHRNIKGDTLNCIKAANSVPLLCRVQTDTAGKDKSWSV